MGRGKLTLPLGDRPVIRHVAEAVLSMRLHEAVVVINPRSGDAIRDALHGLPLKFVCNERFEEGIASSIAAGAEAVSPNCEAMILVQGDQPLVTAEMLRALIGAWAQGNCEFVAAAFGDVITTPVLFSRPLLAELAALRGDTGARSVLKRHHGQTIGFPRWRGIDLDTDEDYAEVQRIWATLA
jgi:molybdenum cofactor cytidylyltransferase